MAVGLTAVGILSYNGIVFDGTSQVTVDIQGVYDEADRSLYAEKHIITVRAIVCANSNIGPTQRPASQIGTADDSVEALRKVLMERGQEFIMVNRGFGRDLVVNPVNPALHTTYYNDVKFGPKPRILHIEPVGSNNCCEIEWQVEINITFCAASAVPIMALNYSATYSIDNRGMTTRVISGYYEIAQTTTGTGLTYSADQFRAALLVTVPVAAPQELTYKLKDQGSAAEEDVTWTWEGMGFQRSQQWEVSPDKSREHFTIVDRQVASNHAFPDYTVSARSGHESVWRRPRRGNGGAFLLNTISAEFELTEGISPALSFFIFASIVNTRLAAANKDDNGATKKRTLIDEFRIREDLFGRISSFQISYRVLGGEKALQNIVQLSGMWKPLGTAWETWTASLTTVNTQYGPSGLKNLAANDGLTTLCGGGSSSNNPNFNVTLPAQPTLTRMWPKNETPDPSYSYLKYQCKVVSETENPVSRQSILQVPSTDTPSASDSSGTNMTTTGTFQAASGPDTPDIIQQGGGPRHSAWIVGVAERVGYPVPRIAFGKIGDATGTKHEIGHYSQTVESNALGVPIYRAEWAVRYVMPVTPNFLNPPTNFEQRATGDGTTFSF